jgi:hypothetical protein
MKVLKLKKFILITVLVLLLWICCKMKMDKKISPSNLDFILIYGRNDVHILSFRTDFLEIREKS